MFNASLSEIKHFFCLIFTLQFKANTDCALDVPLSLRKTGATSDFNLYDFKI